MEKMRSEEGPGSDVLIAGRIYKLDMSGHGLSAVPKGASCSATPRAVPKGASCSAMPRAMPEGSGQVAAHPKTRKR